ncbi:MAG: AAA family ATPase, partial [Spirochaetales bacterium]|nr:AAA family ATPase [Spirochaetales bacterium]
MDLLQALLQGLETVILGKRHFLEYLAACLAAGGHVLIEDVPGLGKTTVAKTLARLLSAGGKENSARFSRIQFTPDLLPYDITGVDVFNPESGRFSFRPGPVFSNIVLADEINRTSPKVQSALLEVMAENQVTIGNKTHAMDPLFFVIATENPVDIEGTYPLPLAQVDRFMMRLAMGYPDPEAEYLVVSGDPSRTIMPSIRPVCGKKEILALRQSAGRVFCHEKLIRAITALGARTREHSGVRLGVSPRGSLMLLQAARALAFVRQRDYVIDQDVIDLAPLVLAHRLKTHDQGTDG